jgi:hypothetical protein
VQSSAGPNWKTDVSEKTKKKTKIEFVIERKKNETKNWILKALIKRFSLSLLPGKSILTSIPIGTANSHRQSVGRETLPG